MKKVTLKELKLNLSEITEVAAKGQAVEVTRYNRPYVVLVSAQDPNGSLRVGKEVGRRPVQSVFNGLTLKQLLNVLSRDRDEDAE